MDKSEVLEKVNRFTDIVIDEYNPLKVVLFGSYARGDWREESDIDVAVIMEKIEGSFLDKSARLFKIRRNIDENIEPLLFESGNDKSGFLDSILSYGEVIYQR